MKTSVKVKQLISVIESMGYYDISKYVGKINNKAPQSFRVPSFNIKEDFIEIVVEGCKGVIEVDSFRDFMAIAGNSVVAPKANIEGAKMSTRAIHQIIAHPVIVVGSGGLSADDHRSEDIIKYPMDSVPSKDVEFVKKVISGVIEIAKRAPVITARSINVVVEKEQGQTNAVAKDILVTSSESIEGIYNRCFYNVLISKDKGRPLSKGA